MLFKLNRLTRLTMESVYIEASGLLYFLLLKQIRLEMPEINKNNNREGFSD